MKIILDAHGEDTEHHAKMMHREMMKKHQLPRLAAATRALIPSWCDECQGRAWGPVMGGPTFCDTCQTERDRRKHPGF